MVQPALVAAQAGEPVSQDPARQKIPELVLHESGQVRAVRPLGRRAQERLQVCAHDHVEGAVLRRALL